MSKDWLAPLQTTSHRASSTRSRMPIEQPMIYLDILSRLIGIRFLQRRTIKNSSCASRKMARSLALNFHACTLTKKLGSMSIWGLK